VPMAAFCPCPGSESSKKGWAYADGMPIINTKKDRKSNLFILHKTTMFII